MKQLYAFKLICVVLLTLPLQLSAQKFLNLDFEKADSTTGLPERWTCFYGDNISKFQQIALDSVVFYSQKKSLCLVSRISAQDNYNDRITLRNNFPVPLVQGKKVSYRAWIKTDSISQGVVDLKWVMFDKQGNSRAIRLKHGVEGTRDWESYTTPEVLVDSSIIRITFGLDFSGQGIAWIDRLEIIVNGKEFVDAPLQRTPEDKELKWLRKNSFAFTNIKAETGLRELKHLKKVVGSARIIALGEATHATSEFFTIKHRMLEYLVKEQQFTLFVMEEQVSTAERINEYIVNDRGNLNELLQLMTRPWQTQEIRDMLKWMHGYNKMYSGKPGFQPIRFLGIDIQGSKATEDSLRHFASLYDPELAALMESVDAEATKFYTALGNGNVTVELSDAYLSRVKQVKQHFEHHQQVYAKKVSVDELKRVAQYPGLILQTAMLYTQHSDNFNYRDQCLAENVDWIVDHHPEGKLVLWAHNGHIGKKPGQMGYLLAEKYGTDYVAVGLTTHEGTYGSLWNNRPTPNRLIPAEVGSYEYYFHKSAQGNFILDLRKINPNNPACEWLIHPADFRSIGAEGGADQFEMIELTKEYDVIIFINKSSPAQRVVK